jgi:hypothetical protein
MSPLQGYDMFCGRIRRVSCELKRVVLGGALQWYVVAEELLLLWMDEATNDGSRPKQ